MIRRLRWLLASGLGSGLAPIASGTAGTLVALPVAAALSLLPFGSRLLVLLALLPLGAWICGGAALEDGHSDPGWIVLDEIIGYCVATAWVSPTFFAYGAGFLLFRLFDIVKPPPAGWIDRRVPGGWGILLDDVFAGLYTAVALALLSRFGMI